MRNSSSSPLTSPLASPKRFFAFAKPSAKQSAKASLLLSPREGNTLLFQNCFVEFLFLENNFVSESSLGLSATGGILPHFALLTACRLSFSGGESKEPETRPDNSFLHSCLSLRVVACTQRGILRSDLTIRSCISVTMLVSPSACPEYAGESRTGHKHYSDSV